MPIYIDGVPYRNLEDQVKYLTEGYNDLSAIATYMPVDVSSTNPLASRAYVDQSVTTVAAHYLTSDALGNNFPTKAALLAGPYFYGIELHLPDENDYAFVNADEDHNGLPSRYVYIMNTWMYQYSLQASGGVVDLTSAQTITGVKNFSNGIKINDIPITYSPDFNSIDIGGNKNLSVYGIIFPQFNNNSDIGHPSYRFKDLHLGGKSYFGNYSYIAEENDFLTIRSNAGAVILVGSLRGASDGSYDIGGQYNRFKDLYLAGNIIGSYKESNTVAYSGGNYVASFNMDADTVNKIKYLEITIESINENYVVMFPVSAVNMSTYTTQHAFKTNGYPIDTIIVNYSGGSLNVLIPYGTSGLTVHVFAKMI